MTTSNATDLGDSIVSAIESRGPTEILFRWDSSANSTRLFIESHEWIDESKRYYLALRIDAQRFTDGRISGEIHHALVYFPSDGNLEYLPREETPDDLAALATFPRISFDTEDERIDLSSGHVSRDNYEHTKKAFELGLLLLHATK